MSGPMPNRLSAPQQHSGSQAHVENAKNGVVRPLLEITKHGYGDEASDTTSCATPTFAPHLRGFFIAARKVVDLAVT